MKTSILLFAALFSVSAFYSCSKNNSGKDLNPDSTADVEETAAMARTKACTNPIVPAGKYHLLNVGENKYYQHNGDLANNPDFTFGVANDSPDPALSTYEVTLLNDSTGYIYSMVNSPSGQLIKSTMQQAFSFGSYRDLGFIDNTTPLKFRFRKVSEGILILYAGNESEYRGHTVKLFADSFQAQIKLLGRPTDAERILATWKFVPAS